MHLQVEQIIVLGSTITALAIARNARALELRCILVDRKEGLAIRSRYVDARVVATESIEAIVDELIRLAHRHSSALIADSDSWLRELIPFRERLDKAFARVLHPPSNALELCLNKSTFLKWCKAESLSAPALFDPRNVHEVDLTRTPVIVRPELTLHGQARRLPKAIEIRSHAELDSLLRDYQTEGVTPCVSESLLRASTRQFSVGIARNERGETQTFVGEKVRPNAARCAGGTYVVSATCPAVAELAGQAILALDYFGIAEIEVFLDEQTTQAFLVEINARPWVQYELARRAGFDFLRCLLDRQPQRAATQLPDMRWLSFWDDLQVCFSRSNGMVRSGELSFAMYLRSLVTANVYPIWSWRDPLPFMSTAAGHFQALTRHGSNESQAT